MDIAISNFEGGQTNSVVISLVVLFSITAENISNNNMLRLWVVLMDNLLKVLVHDSHPTSCCGSGFRVVPSPQIGRRDGGAGALRVSGGGEEGYPSGTPIHVNRKRGGGREFLLLGGSVWIYGTSSPMSPPSACSISSMLGRLVFSSAGRESARWYSAIPMG
jgi:hypothetical protein